MHEHGEPRGSQTRQMHVHKYSVTKKATSPYMEQNIDPNYYSW